MSTQVFGPDRPRAAVRAIQALEDARETYATYGGWAPESAVRRLAQARIDRDNYAEYGSLAAALDRATAQRMGA